MNWTRLNRTELNWTAFSRSSHLYFIVLYSAFLFHAGIQRLFWWIGGRKYKGQLRGRLRITGWNYGLRIPTDMRVKDSTRVSWLQLKLSKDFFYHLMISLFHSIFLTFYLFSSLPYTLYFVLSFHNRFSVFSLCLYLSLCLSLSFSLCLSLFINSLCLTLSSSHSVSLTLSPSNSLSLCLSLYLPTSHPPPQGGHPGEQQARSGSKTTHRTHQCSIMEIRRYVRVRVVYWKVVWFISIMITTPVNSFRTEVHHLRLLIPYGTVFFFD